MAQFCRVCYGTSLTFENGILVCDTCGTQTQTYQEETEFQQGIDDARGRRRAAGSSAAGQQSQASLLAREEQQAAQQLQDAALVYVRCLQHLLQAQSQQLSTKFGVSPQINSLMRQMWLTHLPSTGILEPTPHQPPVAAGVAGARAAAGANRDAAGAAAEEQDTRMAGAGWDDEEQQGEEQQQLGLQQRAAVMVQPKNMKILFWKLLHPQVTLQLCFLSCILLREAVTFYDILTWALDGQLPFLDLPSLASNSISESELNCLPVRCLQPEVSLSPLAFCSSCCQLADQLGLKLPPVAGEALLLRMVKELGLPLVVYELSLQLYFLYVINSPKVHLSAITKPSQVAPYAWLAAVLLVAIKLMYGLGNAAGQVPLVAKAAPPPAGWQVWAEHVLQHLPGICSMPLTEDEASTLGPETTQQYLQYLRHHMFAGQPAVSTFEDIQRLLLGWYDASTSKDAQQQQQQQQHWHLQQPEGTQQLPSAVAPAAAAVQQQAGMHRTVRIQQGQSTLAQEVAAAPTAALGQAQQPGELHGLVTPATQPVHEQQQQQQGQADTGLAAPGCGVPRWQLEGLENYTLVMLSSSAASGSYRLQPELAAVVVAVAGYSRVSPAMLLDCVRAIEKLMVSAESGIKMLQAHELTAVTHAS